MPKLSLPAKLFAAGALTLAVVAGAGLLAHRPARAQDLSQSVASASKDWSKFHYVEAKDCKACHTVPVDDYKSSLDVVMLTEYAIWKTHDKHAQAYAVLKGERGRKMAERLYPKESKEKAHGLILEAKAGCLGCHAMGNLPAKEGAKLDLEDGVSCTGCHGPAGGDGAWLGTHQQKSWRDKSPADKYKAGLRNLRDPVVRAELCMSCHIGNAGEGKVVSHAM